MWPSDDVKYFYVDQTHVYTALANLLESLPVQVGIFGSRDQHGRTRSRHKLRKVATSAKSGAVGSNEK